MRGEIPIRRQSFEDNDLPPEEKRVRGGEGMRLYFTGNDRRQLVGQIQRNHKFQ